MLHFRSSRSSSGWMACAPSGARARFAVVDRSAAGGRPAVRWVHEEAWDGDPTRALRHAFRLGHAKRHPCVALLQRSQYQLLPMDAPDVPREEWRSAVRWRLKDMVDFPVESAGIDVLEVPAGASSRPQAALVAAAAPAEAVRPLLEAGEEAGVSWQALDVAETALRNLSALLATPGRSHALLHFGETHGTLVITLDGELLLSRQIDVPQSQIASADENARQAAFDRAGLELQRTLDGFERVFTQTSLERLQVLPGEGVEAFCDYARELVYTPVAEADPVEVLDLEGLPALKQPGALAPYLLAIGAALRPSAPAPAAEGAVQQLNLVDEALRPKHEGWRAAHGLWAFAGTLLAAFGLSLLMDHFSAGRLARAQAVQQQTAAERQLLARNGGNASPDAAGARQAELQRLRNLEASQRQVHAALDTQMGGRVEGYTPYFLALSRQANPALWITGFGVGADGQALEIQGRMTDAAALPDYLRKLNAEPQFRGRSFAQLDLKAADPHADTGVVEFSLRSQPPGNGRAAEDTR